MTSSSPIELLAPAKDLNTGLEAINHGADAVYIGGPSFGARAAAGNSVADIEKLVAYAHLFGAKVYVTVNTILTDEELPAVQSLIADLYRIRVDALLVQDMALLSLPLPPIPLHASTQMDIRDRQKIQFLQAAGISRVVLARELSLDEIKAIHAATPMPLEAFVHGALCVSYSGRCYASQACFGRSANRGECAQFCRLPFTLEDADGKVIVEEKHLLSLKDMNRGDSLEELLDAGVTSLKIEGRLKDCSYVKNITAWYRRKLDAILERRPEYCRASAGRISLTFTPDPAKSFNRGFTDYFLHGRTADIFSFDTPKAMGEPVGVVKERGDNWLTVAGSATFSNGDGLCYLDREGHLQGFKVNLVQEGRLFPYRMPQGLSRHTPLFRNWSQEFEKLLAQKSGERKIEISICFYEIPFGYCLTLTDEEGTKVSVNLPIEKSEAKSPQEESRRDTLTKLGDTPFVCTAYEATAIGFIPVSQLARLRRTATDLMVRARILRYRQTLVRREPTTHPYPLQQLTYLGNVYNSEAAGFYRAHGVQSCAFAFERKAPQGEVPIMFCRHCLRYSLGGCLKRGGRQLPWREPYFLVSRDGRRFGLQFDCSRCEMRVLNISSPLNG